MNPTTETKTETLADVLAEMELGNTGDFPFAYRVGMPDEPEVIDVTGAIIKPRAIRIKNVTVKELVDRIKAARERERGNSAAMREAVEKMCDLFERGVICTSYANTTEEMEQIGELYRKAKAALAKPPRQCDVGTEEEQIERFNLQCFEHHTGRCSPHCRTLPAKTRQECALKWAQMPYAEGGAK